MFPTRFVSRATTTTTIRSDVRSSSCICVSGGRWSTASVYGASSTVPAVTGARDAEVLGTAAVTVSCPTGQQDIARSAGAPSSCMPASSFRGNCGRGSCIMPWDCRGGEGVFAQRQNNITGVPPSLSAGCLSDHRSGVISATVLVWQDVCVFE